LGFYEISALTQHNLRDAIYELISITPRPPVKDVIGSYKMVILGAGAVGKVSFPFCFVLVALHME